MDIGIAVLDALQEILKIIAQSILMQRPTNFGSLRIQNDGLNLLKRMHKILFPCAQLRPDTMTLFHIEMREQLLQKQNCSFRLVIVHAL
jgi:hypothetical protein